MSMAVSAPLQRALFEQLSAAPELAEIFGRIHDDAPHRSREQGATPYVTLGDEVVQPWDTSTDRGAAHEAVIRVHAPQRGFLRVKELAAKIVELIEANPPTPSRGVVVTHQFIGARTRREENGASRRVDLTFRFVVEDDG
ncbi:MAG: DUF3168 domain-containing protein [Pikeienuella sp.]